MCGVEILILLFDGFFLICQEIMHLFMLHAFCKTYIDSLNVLNKLESSYRHNNRKK